ncbi:hypothetical protein AB0E96_36050 [Kitasatospora sp. NPDC036755]
MTTSPPPGPSEPPSCGRPGEGRPVINGDGSVRVFLNKGGDGHAV